MGIVVTLVKSSAGASKKQLDTIRGLGLRRLGSIRTLPGTPEVRGMVKSVLHLLSVSESASEPSKRNRVKPRKIRVRDAAIAAFSVAGE
jgi:large subunit ribosomal protein L30